MQIRDDVDGTTNANKQLEAHSRLITEVLSEISPSKAEFEKAGRRISQAAKECLAISGELTTLLLEVRGAGRAKPLSAARATLRALKSNRKIEKLKNALKERQAALDAAIAHDIR